MDGITSWDNRWLLAVDRPPSENVTARTVRGEWRALTPEWLFTGLSHGTCWGLESQEHCITESSVSTRSGMLEAGVDRIISQVVDPKLNHIFRPQIERAIHEFLAAKKKEVILASSPELENQDPAAPPQDAP